MREGRLGVSSEGLWSDAPAHDSIRLTPRGEVRLVSGERSQGVETDQTLEPSTCAAASTRGSLSVFGDEALATMESILRSAETPRWSSSGQAASLTNTFAALPWAGVHVANTTLDEVGQSLRRCATVTTVAQGVEVEFTLKPRSCRPCIVERKEDNTTFKVRFLENLPPLQREVQVEAMLLAMHSGIVNLERVRKEDDEVQLEAMMEEIDACVVAPVPRERSPKGKEIRCLAP